MSSENPDTPRAKTPAEMLAESNELLRSEVISLQKALSEGYQEREDLKRELAEAKEELAEEPRRARVTAEMPADSLIALAGLGDWQAIPTDHPARLAANGLTNIVRYAPAGKRVRVRMEWETDLPDWEREADRENRIYAGTTDDLGFSRGDTEEEDDIDGFERDE